MLLRSKEIPRTRGARAGHLAGVLALLLMLTACGGGDAGPPAPSVPAGPGVWIKTPTSEPTFTNICNSAWISGEAGYGKNRHCCNGTAEELTGVNVTWNNAATCTFGKATQELQLCPWLYFCGHTWSASIPLVVGDNRITVTATDTITGAVSTATITIHKPIMTYTISGTFLSHLGVPPQHVYASLEITRDRPGGQASTAVGYNGVYALGCVPDGTYIVTPSSTINYDFAPANRTVTVAGADVPGQNFTAQAFTISGGIVYASNDTPVSNQAIRLSGSGSDASVYTSTDGTYSFLVPNGTYTLTPDTLGLPQIQFVPSSRNVTVNNADVSSQDFIAELH